MIFGPVPSRRLGYSLGINNIPPKECSYACIYCQLGNTLQLEKERKDYYSTKQIISNIEKHLSKLKSNKEIDFITFVPDGEPTLDINLGETIEACKKFEIKIAVITNASHIWDKDIQLSLGLADWVSLKIDTVNPQIWHKVNRPHGKLSQKKILNGIKEFAVIFNNFLVTETMLVKNYNDNEEVVLETATFINDHIRPKVAYISVPTRPPAEKDIQAPSIESLSRSFLIFKSQGLNTELITEYEGNNFSTTGNFEEDLLSITAVHPMRKDAVEKLIKEDKTTWEDVTKLIKEEILVETIYNNESYYLRNLKGWRKENLKNVQ